MKKLIKIFSLIFIITVFASVKNIYAMSSSLKEEKPLQLPARVPIDVTKKGNKVEALIEVKKKGGYAFELEFHYDDPRRSKYAWVNFIKSFFPEKKYSDEEYREIMKDNNRVWKLVGCNTSYCKSPGVPTPIHLIVLKIKDDGSKEMVFDEIKNPVLDSWGYTFNKKISIVRFDSGLYKISAESIKDSPDLSGTNIYLLVIEELITNSF